MQSLLPIFKYFDKSWIGLYIADSKWIFPAVEAVHIVALALLFGAIMMLNLRLFGLVLKNKSVSQLARELAPWVLCSLVIILISGFLLFTSEAMKSYASTPFRWKMAFLFTAIVFHYTFFRSRTNAIDSDAHPWLNKVTAVLSFLLWAGVGIGGRGIGFL